MRKFVLGVAALMALAMTAMAGDWTGYISDAGCTKNQGATKVASADHAGCAEACLKKGDKAVLVTEEGKVYQIANQDKIANHFGHKVTLTGDMSGDSITVSEVKM